MKLTDADIQQIASTIERAVHPLQVLLFGSYAEGTATEDSDLDLLVVMSKGSERFSRHFPRGCPSLFASACKAPLRNVVTGW